MRQVLLAGPKKIEAIDVPVPEVQPGWILARTLRTGICGTDVHSYFGETIFGKVFPFHIGHEVCAVVEETHPTETALKPGDTIVVNPFFTCGACPACYQGHENNCAHKTTIGLKGFGGFSEYVYVPATSAFKVTGKDYNALSMAEPLATVVYGFDKLRVDATKRIRIQGAGPIGLLFLQLALASNAAQVVAVDFNREKLKAARALGAHAALCPSDEADSAVLEDMTREGFDIVIDCTGSIKSMQSCVDMAAFGGQILLFGLCAADAAMTFRPFQLYQKDACIMASFALNRQSFGKAVALLENGKINTELLIDSVQPLDQLENSILRIASGEASGKIIIDTTR